MRIGSDYVIPLDVRVLAAANENLSDKVRDGSFRNDLFYRLSILKLTIPPLRKRREDIIPLFRQFLKINAKNNIPDIDEKVEESLLSYSWPGNVRELRNAAERFLLLGDLGIEEEALIMKSELKNFPHEEINSDFKLDLKEINRHVELKVIEMLENQGMSKNEIAKVLGISRSSLWNKTQQQNESKK